MKVYIDTMGCPKNHNDSELVMGLLRKAGYEIAEEPETADAVMVNTCGFINDAKVESIDRIFELNEIKKPGGALVVTGCLSQRYGEELFNEMTEADIMLGVNDYSRLPAALDEYFAARNKCSTENLSDKQGNARCDSCDSGISAVCLGDSYNTADDSVHSCSAAADSGNNTDDISGDSENSLSRKLYCSQYDGTELDYRLRDMKGCYSTTLKISEGCNNCCTYCVIPEIRGRFRSRPLEEIVAEARLLAASGIRELLIIGQDVTAYGRDLYGKFALAELIRRLDAVEGISWIRLLYCYEDEITDELIDAIAECQSVCNYIDIPLQHCADGVLKRMHRRSTSASIRSKLEKIRSRIPDMAIRTTLITGFPGESQEDFDELLGFVDEMKFERLGVFAYSREEGTPAYDMPGQVDEDLKQDRLGLLMEHQMNISLEFNRKQVGKRFTVLVDQVDEDGSYVGRTYMDAPEIDDSVLFTSPKPLKPGEFVEVEITDAFDYDLVGYAIDT